MGEVVGLGRLAERVVEVGHSFPLLVRLLLGLKLRILNLRMELKS